MNCKLEILIVCKQVSNVPVDLSSKTGILLINSIGNGKLTASQLYHSFMIEPVCVRLVERYWRKFYSPWMHFIMYGSYVKLDLQLHWLESQIELVSENMHSPSDEHLSPWDLLRLHWCGPTTTGVSGLHWQILLSSQYICKLGGQHIPNKLHGWPIWAKLEGTSNLTRNKMWWLNRRAILMNINTWSTWTRLTLILHGKKTCFNNLLSFAKNAPV